MSTETREREWNYPQQLVQVMREHELIQPEEEEQMMSYLWMTH
jgi:HD-like signal output (HDOD) protein